MTRELGSYNTTGTRTNVRFQFSTHASAGGNVAPSSAFEAADLRIYRAADSAAYSATQRNSSNGVTMTSPFDSLTGVHDIAIDLTDNSDAGFYAAGYRYSVVLAPDETVDSQTITGVVLAEFEIGPPPANVTQLGGSSQSLTDLKDFADDGYDPSTNKVAGVVLVDTLTTYTGNTPQTGDSYAIVNNGTYGNAAIKTLIDAVDNFVDTEVTAIKAKTDFLPSATAGDAGGLLIAGTNAATTFAQLDVSGTVTINSSVTIGANFSITGTLAAGVFQVNGQNWTDAIAGIFQGYGLDHLVAVAVAGSDVADNSIVAKLVSKSATADWDSFVNTTDALEALRDRGDAAWVTATGFSTHSAADVWAVATRVLTAGTNIQLPSNGLANISSWSVAITGNITGNLSGSIGSLATQAKADVNAEVLDVLNVDTLIDGKTIAQAVIYVGAICAGRISGAGTGTEVFKGLDESTTRVTVSVDDDGNRTDVTYG